MKSAISICVVMAGISLVLCGCGPKKPQTTGFLSDYSKLESESNVSYKYIAPNNALGNYSKFIIDPVAIHFYDESKGGKVKEKDLTAMQDYMHDVLVNAIEDKYEIAYASGPGVARLRAAITDLKKSRILMKIWPTTKLVGTGLGGATLEAELVDSQTGEQIGSLVESQVGKRLSLEGLSSWGDARAVMDRWAARFRQRLDEAHER